MKTGLAVFVLLAAVGVWLWRCNPTGAPTETDLRQTAGVTVEVLTARPTPQGVEVTCRVQNATTRPAVQVVFHVSLRTSDGQTVAANPLASVSGLAPGQTRDAVILVPSREPLPNTQPHADISLVRWGG